MGWGHLMHAIRVNRERASNSYPFRQGKEGEGGEKKKRFPLGMKSGAASTQ